MFGMLLYLAGWMLVFGWPSAQAQLSTQGEVTFGTTLTLSPAVPAQVGLALGGYVQAEYRRDLLALRLALQPEVWLSPLAEADLGLSELSATASQGALTVTLGMSRLPLEYARLSLPFSLEPSGRLGQRRGLLGLQASWFADDWRLRAVLAYREGLIPLVGVKRSFGSFELELHALYAGRPIVGLGGSGLAGTLVIYGERWLLLTPLEGRGAVGVTGVWGEALWTLEAAWAPPGPALAPQPTALGQLALPLGPDAGLNLLGSATLGPDALRATLSVGYSYLEAEREVTALVRAQLGPEPPVVGLGLLVTGYF